jgi:isoleucyl-tRNA synthetase
MQTNKNPLSAFFIDMEHKWLASWGDNNIYRQYLDKNKKSDKYFSFQDGPITANNPMGVHHAWGRTYKDLWQRFHNLLGFRQRFQNGFDCQGLWVEVEVEKELGLRSKKDIENLVPGDKVASIAKFVELCRERVFKYANIQTEQSKRLAYFMDWENSYFTMDEENNYMIWHFLKTCHKNGWIYKGKDSVPWCPRCETAISQHEMLTEDYKEIVHETVFFKLKIQKSSVSQKLQKVVADMSVYFVAWTTTPWTIPGNVALGINKDLEYVFVRHNEQVYILAEDRLENVLTTNFKLLLKVKGSELIGIKYDAPFDFTERSLTARNENSETFHTVVDATDIVTATEGTGILHIAPGQGKEDFELGKKYKLPIIELIADDASYFEGLAQFSGKNAKKHPELIIDFLNKEASDFLLKTEKYKHRYPACWRCKAELVWKIADEWYIAMDKPSKTGDQRTLRARMIEVAKKITWMPSFGLDRELDWLNNMHDWLISKKNRYWGLALPIYECDTCENFDVIGSKDELKERSISGFDTFEGLTPHKPFIDEVIISCSKCGQKMSRIGDVGNPWLDAGIVPYSTIKRDNKGKPLYLIDKKEWKKWFPANFITESFPGQFKKWFYAMIAMSTVLEDVPPYERVLGFATLTGEDGRPMHKSWGNSIAFEEGADIIGVDVMRWMYARQNPGENLLFGYHKADEVRRSFYLILWNSFKFYLQNREVDNIKYVNIELDIDKLQSVLDRYILYRLEETINSVYESLKKFDAKNSAWLIEEFVQDLSTWYIRRSRDRVGPAAEILEKESFYKVMQQVFYKLSIILSPFMPFISEEIYTILTGNKSVHLESWPQRLTLKSNEVITDMNLIRRISECGHRVRKDLKLKVRQPLSKVEVSLPSQLVFVEKELETQYIDILCQELNVKSVIFLNKSDISDISISYDTTLTNELIIEGELRDLLREIQQKRKELHLGIKDSIKLTIPKKFAPFKDKISLAVSSNMTLIGEALAVEKSI